MTEMDTILDLAREAVLLVLLLAAPTLLAGLVVAAVVGILQAATQVQDPTLSLVPKIVAMLLVAAATGPWVLQRLVEFSQRAFGGP